MHGRDRIFVVLAGRASLKSIPGLLRTRAVVEADGIQTVASSPLAANLHDNTKNKGKEELLRIIAAVASCNYDDLKRRDRSRKRKRAVRWAVLALLVVLAITSAVGVALKSRHDADVTDSQRLALESTRLLSQGDKEGAIRKALEALPQAGYAPTPCTPPR